MRLAITFVIAVFAFNKVYAEDNPAPNYSKFQSNYYFTCPKPMACIAAFEKMLAAPEIAEKGYEVSLMALAHNGWDESTHMVSFYFKNAERYLEAGQTFSTSPAFAEFLAAAADVGVENQSQTLTTHSITKGDSRGSRSQVIWTINVSDPGKFIPAWQKMSDSFNNYSWGANAYGLQGTLLGNQGWATHEVWAAFDTPVQALNFLEKFYLTPEFREYDEAAGDAAALVRSYIANSVVVSNED